MENRSKITVPQLAIVCLVLLFGVFAPNLSEAQNNDWANFAKYDAQNKAVLEGGFARNRVVFMGDSITEGWDLSKFRRPEYIGRGISGQTTPQMLVRFRADVISLKPAAVVILAGTNDVAGNTGPATNEMIVNNIASMCDIAKAHNVKIVLISILPAAKYPWAPSLEPAPRIIEINKTLKEYARLNRIEFVDLHTLLNDGTGGLKSQYTFDGVHLNAEGYSFMSARVAISINRVLGRR